MSKKSLSVLLLLPFLLSVLFFVTSSFLFTKIQGDITNIMWNYKNQEAFSLTAKQIKLEAVPVLANHQEDVDATLIWTVSNSDSAEDPHAEICTTGEETYLSLISVGDVVVTCTNTSGNVSKSFRAKIYLGSAVIINTARSRSYQSIEGTDYYGTYDFLDGEETDASFYLDVALQSDGTGDVTLDQYQVQTSSNITYDSASGKVTIHQSGQGFVKYALPYDDSSASQYDFTIVGDGYNVYSYDDLLRCTNESEEGRIVCLQTNMDSLKNTYEYDDDGAIKTDAEGEPILKEPETVLFGNYSLQTKTFSFENEVYRFESTYNTEYIDQYNAQKSASAPEISKTLIAGIRIQKDFYGNGYMINAHDLTYPSGTINVGDTLAALTDRDLFRGPLPLVLIGNAEAPIVKAYGQDNVGFYIDGDGILLDDVFFKNCDFSNILQNNDTTGTVVEIHGNDVSVVNSHLSSGRTVLRAFSAENLLVRNSLLEKGREFIAKIGSEDYEKIDMDEPLSFTYEGKDYTLTRREFFSGSGEISAQSISQMLLMSGLSSDVPSYQKLAPLAEVLQEALNPRSVVEDENHELIFKGDATFEDTYFYQSGLFSIGIETQFNGPYLYDGSPVQGYLDQLISGMIYPDDIAGVSYPTRTVLKGDTRFYDYKTLEETDTNSLVFQDVSSLIGEAIDLDSFFPVKRLFLEEASKKGYVHTCDGGSYLSAAIAKFGGGANRSIIDATQLYRAEELVSDIVVDTFEASMTSSPASTELTDLFPFLVGRCVSMAMGFAPFEISMYNGHGSDPAYLFGEQVSLDNLRSRA